MRGKAPKEKKRFKKQRHYYSDSEEEDDNVARDAPRKSATEQSEDPTKEPEEPVQPSGANATVVRVANAGILKKTPPQKSLEELAEELDVSSADEQDEFDVDGEDDDETGKSDTDASDEDSDLSETSTNNARRVKKRNDPEAFATSISKILGTKLTTTKRSEPILSRSKTAQDTNKSLADHKLTLKANRQVIAEKKAVQEKGRVKDVLGLQKEEVSTAEIVAEEKRLRRTAQKGVIKLFNAVRAAQVKAEQAEQESKQKGVVGLGKRAENVQEMSKQGFLDMIAGGGKKKKEGSVEA
jgi:fusion and transport protein UGO1